MILVAAVGLGALTVPLLGGSLASLAALRITRAWTVALALALQILIISVIPQELPRALADGLHLLSYALVLVFVRANRRIPWLWLVGLGGLANLVAIGANHAVMPASREALRAAGLPTEVRGFTNSTYQASEHLRALGDIFWIPRGWPLANVFSPGDVVLVVGATLLLHTVCGSRLTKRRSAAVGIAAPVGDHGEVGQHRRPGHRRPPAVGRGLEPGGQ